MAMSRDAFDGGAAGTWSVEAKGAATHPTRHETVPTSRDYQPRTRAARRQRSPARQ